MLLFHIFITSVLGYFLSTNSCDNPRYVILPQTIDAVILENDTNSQNVGTDPNDIDKGVWISMKGYDLMINIDTCSTSSSDCTTELEVTKNCEDLIDITYNEKGNNKCSIKFYGKEGVMYKVKVIVTNSQTCDLEIEMKETDEKENHPVNLWWLFSIGTIIALLIITAIGMIIFVIVKRKRVKKLSVEIPLTEDVHD